MILRAPAKLNLWLRLTGVRRPDGRHELESHFAPLDLADRLTLRPATAFSLTITGPEAAGVPGDERNLVWQAFDGFCRAFGPQPALSVHIDKQIPHGAGLGGGSSDAGALLAYLATRAALPLQEVREWSLSLGADIPAAFRPRARLVQGVGEGLGAPNPAPDRAVFLIKPAALCHTAAVFKAWAARPVFDHPSGNDLETAACQVCPEIATILDLLRREVDAAARITGSGSACFALVPPGWRPSDRLAQDLAPYWTQLTRFQAKHDTL